MPRLLFILLILSASIFPAPARAQTHAAIKIIKPGDRRNLALGNAEIQVEITGVNLQDGYTWQPFLDSVPQGVVRNALTAQIQVGKPTGPRRIQAVLYASNGAQLAAHEILVIAAPVENRGEVFNRSWFVPVMAVFSLLLVGLLALALRLRPRPNS